MPLPLVLLLPAAAAAATAAAEATLVLLAAAAAGYGISKAASVLHEMSESESEDTPSQSGTQTCPFGDGTLTEDELKGLQDIADKYKTPIDVIGSRAEGKGRNIDKPELEVGKGEGTRSDIDVRIDGQADIDSRGRLSNDITKVGNGAGSIASSTGLESDPPVIRIRPNQPPTHVK